jgi:hypothetical protein
VEDRAFSLRRLESELGLAVQHAVILAGAGDSDLSIANRVFDAEKDLVRRLTRRSRKKTLREVLEKLGQEHFDFAEEKS